MRHFICILPLGLCLGSCLVLLSYLLLFICWDGILNTFEVYFFKNNSLKQEKLGVVVGVGSFQVFRHIYMVTSHV